MKNSKKPENKKTTGISFEESFFLPLKENIMQEAVKLEGAINVSALVESVHLIVERHDVLRTIYREEGGRFYREIDKKNTFSVTQVDMRGGDEGYSMNAVRQRAEIDYSIILSFKKPLFRVSLISFCDNCHVLLLSCHHAVFDGWAFGVFFNELSALYASYQTGKKKSSKPLPVQYSDYVDWQKQWLQTDHYVSLEKYWSKRLAGLAQRMNLPVDHPRSETTAFTTAILPVDISDELFVAMETLSQELEITEFIILLSAVGTLLAYLANQKDIYITYSRAGRVRKEYEDIIGTFADFMVFRSQVELENSFKSLLLNVKQSAFNDFGNMQMPFVLLKRMLNKTSSDNYKHLFQVVLNVIPQTGDLALPDASVEWIDPGEIRNLQGKAFPMNTDGIEIVFLVAGKSVALIYNNSLFSEQRMKAMADSFTRLIASAMKDPDKKLCDLVSLKNEIK